MSPITDIADPQQANVVAEIKAGDGAAATGVNAAVASGLQPAKKVRSNFDAFVAKVRDKSPDWVVNNGTRICLAFKASADGMSVWSALRKGSQSPHRLVASIITLGTEVLGMMFPEKKISEEKQEEYATMSKPRYFLTKTLEALHPKQHIAETAGAATIMNGVFTTLSGLSQSSKRQFSWETLQGISTLVAGLFMTYMPDRERAWQVSHMIFNGVSPIRLKQSYDAYYTGFPDKNIAKGDWQQFAKWVLNQIANMLGVFYGGVKKLPDGSIEHIGKKGEDTTAPRQSRQLVDNGKHAHTEAHVKVEETQTQLTQPKTQVSQVDPVQKMVSPALAAELNVGAA